MITIGFASARSGRKAHRHCNGYAMCGAGRLVEAPRGIADGDVLCRHCARHIVPLLDWEIDGLQRRRGPECRRRVTMLARFVESSRKIDEVHAEAIEVDVIRSGLRRIFYAGLAA